MPELLSSERQTPNRVIALFAPPPTRAEGLGDWSRPSDYRSPAPRVSC